MFCLLGFCPRRGGRELCGQTGGRGPALRVKKLGAELQHIYKSKVQTSALDFMEHTFCRAADIIPDTRSSPHDMGKTIQVYILDVFSGYWEHVLDKESIMAALNTAEPYCITKPMERFKHELIDDLDYYNNRRNKAKRKGLPPAIHRQQALSAA